MKSKKTFTEHNLNTTAYSMRWQPS